MDNQKVKGKQIKKVELYPKGDLSVRNTFNQLEEADVDVVKYHGYRQKTHELRHLKSMATNVKTLTTITIIWVILSVLVAILILSGL